MPSKRTSRARPNRARRAASAAARDRFRQLAADVGEAAARHAAAAVGAGHPPEEGLPSLLHAIARAFSELPDRIASRIRRFVSGGFLPSLLDPETLRGIGVLLSMSARSSFEEVRARARGEYEVDEFGLDSGYLERVRPLLSFLYRRWWRVKVTGLSNVPDAGRALLVPNHSGVIAWDAAMIATAIMDEHPSGRLARALHLEWFVRTPFAGPFLQRTGQLMACPENGERLLQRDHLVTVFPEGAKGAGKLFWQRYKLARFGRGGFVRMALRTKSPIVPVAVVGGEEIHPMLLKVDPLARLFGLPYFPVTPTFPWLGPLGLVPLPSRWRIHFGEPIRLEHLGPDDADDFHVVSQVSDEVRTSIQERVDSLRAERGNAFL